MPTRIAFAGLSRLCEDVLRAGLEDRPDLELIEPWTQLLALSDPASRRDTNVLFIELIVDELPHALRMLLAAAPALRIVGLAPDASQATVFTLHERRTIAFGPTADRLWRLSAAAA